MQMQVKLGKLSEGSSVNWWQIYLIEVLETSRASLQIAFLITVCFRLIIFIWFFTIKVFWCQASSDMLPEDCNRLLQSSSFLTTYSVVQLLLFEVAVVLLCNLLDLNEANVRASGFCSWRLLQVVWHQDSFHLTIELEYADCIGFCTENFSVRTISTN